MKPVILYMERRGSLSGGGQISLLHLLRFLDRERFEPVVLCPEPGSLVRALEQASIRTIVLPLPSLRLFNPFALARTLRELRRIVRLYGVSLIHANATRPALYAALLRPLTRTPFVWHVRIAESDGIYDTLLLRSCARVIAVSRAVMHRFAGPGGGKKISLIYNGVDFEEFDPGKPFPDIRAEFGIQPTAPLIGVIGNMTGRKGHERFFEAARLIREAHHGARFLLVGDGPLRERLESLAAQPALAGSVIFAGHRTDIPRILKGMDIVVQPSEHPEACNRAILESMAMGKAVVANDTGGNGELLENGVSGLLVPCGHHQALAQSVIRLLNDTRLRRALGEAAFLRARSGFDIRKSAEEVQTVYRELLGESS